MTSPTLYTPSRNLPDRPSSQPRLHPSHTIPPLYFIHDLFALDCPQGVETVVEDRSIFEELLRNAQGLLFLTVAKVLAGWLAEGGFDSATPSKS